MSAKKKHVAKNLDYLQRLFAKAERTVAEFVNSWNESVPGSAATTTNAPPTSLHFEVTITMPDKLRYFLVSVNAAQLPIPIHPVRYLLMHRNILTLD